MPADAQDIPVIAEMLHEMYAASKYRGRLTVRDKVVGDVLLAAIAGQAQNGPQASYVHIERKDGRAVGFMIGTLSRIYHITDKLVAQDLFLYVRPGSSPAHLLRMIDGYIGWARANPKVIEIGLSWNDTLPGAERIAGLYQRKGFHRVGELYEMRLDVAGEMAA